MITQSLHYLTIGKTKGIITKNRGSALMIVMVTLMLLALFSVMGFTAITSMTRRSYAQSYEKQAYLTAKSACDIIASQIVGGDEYLKSRLGTLVVGNTLSVDNIVFEHVNMGDVQGEIYRSFSDQYDINITASYRGAKYSMTSQRGNR